MRFIHTADWHLWRSFYNVSLIDDQAYVLNQLIDFARDSHPDVLIVAGDIYDRALPPLEAVKLLDEVLCRLILDLKVSVILIGGNHDSPLRMEFASRLMETHRLYVFGSLTERLHMLDMFDEGRRITFFPLPYSEPSHTSEYFNIPRLANHEDALRQWVTYIKSNRLAGSHMVLIHHAYVLGSEISESERPLDVGGADTVSVECFDDFDYVALGHLHRSQSIGKNGIINYSGSLLKYSFSEVEHKKSVKLVEMDANGKCKVETVPLHPKRDMRCVEGTMENLLRGNVDIGSRDDYIQVRLLDIGAVFEAMNRLREVFPYLVVIDHTSLIPVGGDISHVDHRKRELIGLFGDFYKYVTDENLTEEQITAFSNIVNRMRESERQV